MLLKLRVVEDVEVFEPQFQARPSLFEWNGFEQGPIEVEESRPHDHVFSGIAKALVWARHPREQSDFAKELVLNHASRFFG